MAHADHMQQRIKETVVVPGRALQQSEALILEHLAGIEAIKQRAKVNLPLQPQRLGYKTKERRHA